MFRSNQKEVFFFLGILLLAFVSRSVFIEADAPLNLTWSSSTFSDSESRAVEARNLALFGQIYPIDCDLPKTFMSPVMTGLLYPVFSLFGVGVIQLRLVSVIFSVLSIALLYFLAKSFSGQKVAFLSAFFLALSFPAMMFDKIGFLETFVVFFLLLSLFLFNKSRNGNSFALVAGSLASFCIAFLFKPTAIIFVPVLLVVLLASRKASKKPSLSQTGILAIALFVFFGIISFLDSRFFDLSGGNVPTHLAFSLFEMLRNFTIFFVNRIFFQSAVVTGLALIALLFALQEFLSKGFSASKGRLLMASWLLFGSAGLALLSYQPPRYFLILLPPLSFLAADFLISFFDSKKFSLPKLSRLAVLGFFSWLALASFAFSIWSVKFLFNSDDMTAKAITVLLLSAAIFVIGTLLFLLVKRKQGFSFGVSRKARQAILLIVLFAFLVSNLVPYFDWASNPKYTLVNSSRQLAKDIPEESVVLGLSTDCLCFETNLKCILMFYTFNNKQPFERFKPSHLLIKSGRDDKLLDKIYPNGWRNRLEFIKNYYVGRDEIGLYRVKN